MQTRIKANEDNDKKYDVDLHKKKKPNNDDEELTESAEEAPIEYFTE